MEDYYEYNYKEIGERIEQIEREIKDEGIVIYHGNEIYATTNMKQILTDRIATPINGSRYVLFEFPMNERPINMLEVIYQIKEVGSIPIIAHPERYVYVQKDPNMLLELIDEGVLFQANYGSIVGQYGEQSRKTVIKLLKNNFIHFFGSDVHRSNSIYTRMDEVLETIEKTIGKEKTREYTYINPRLVLENKDIEFDEPIEIKEKGFFNKLFSK